MALQSGITCAVPGEPFKVVDDIPRPTPGPGQVLVKTLAVGINPIDYLQQLTGILVTEWPAIVGSDCAAVVIEVGPDCKKLKPGDHVYGCAAIGQNRFTPFQETFLVDETVFFKKAPSLSMEQSCAIGVGLLTAALGILAGGELDVPERVDSVAEKDEWIVVLGGSGYVGQYAVQLGRMCGYKVLASCSPSRSSIALQSGATATFNGRGTPDEQVRDIEEATGGNFARIFDATTHGYEVMIKALRNISKGSNKYLSSVDDWSEFATTSPVTKVYRVSTGQMCRRNEKVGAEVTKYISAWIPTLEAHLAAGTLRPAEYQVADDYGWEAVIQGIKDTASGKAAKKIVVRVRDQ